MAKFLIGADVVPTESNYDLFSKAEVEILVGKELNEILKTADYRVFNLETPLCDEETPIIKCGPNLNAPVRTVRGIKALNPSLLTLANNHIMDQGNAGYFCTIKTLSENGIEYVGVGDNVASLKKSTIICVNEDKIKVGFYACAEYEYTIAERDKPGANPFDALYSLDEIEMLKEQCDYVVVLYHGGKEHYRYPSPRLQKICHRMIEKGADVVVTQHSHCIGCFEEYINGLIVYGQGNFLFDRANNEFWNTSLLIELNIDNSGFSIDYIPLMKEENTVRLANGKSGEQILEEFRARSELIKRDLEQIEIMYREFARGYEASYYSAFGGVLGSIVNRLDRLFKGRLRKVNYNSAHRLDMLDYLKCDAHRELFENILEESLKDKNRTDE